MTEKGENKKKKKKKKNATQAAKSEKLKKPLCNNYTTQFFKDVSATFKMKEYLKEDLLKPLPKI